MGTKKRSDIQVKDTLGGKIIKITHPDGSTSAFIKQDGTTKLSKVIGKEEE